MKKVSEQEVQAEVPATTEQVKPEGWTEIEGGTEEVVVEAAVPSEFMTFAETAKQLGVRFQQVFQRAVVRGKMDWHEDGKHKVVRRSDVAAWAKVRAEYFRTQK